MTETKTSATVIPLTADDIVPGEPYPPVVETLERLLAEAKAGRLIGLAYAGACSTGLASCGFDVRGGMTFRNAVATGILWLSYRYAKDLDADT